MKVCWQCKHFNYMNGHPAWSDLTPGDDAEMTCAKEVWTFSFVDSNQAAFEAALSKAETCSQFEARDSSKG